MSAALLKRLQDAGIEFEANGDKLRVEAPSGVLTRDLRTWIVEHKPDVLAAIRIADCRSRMLRIAGAELIDPGLVHALPDDELSECVGSPDDDLRTYLHDLRDGREHQCGRRLLDETDKALCARCGPIWVASFVSRVAPVVTGWPRAAGCVWCANRRAGRPIPRPPVSCDDCVHFSRDQMNPAGGMGRCLLGVAGRTLPYPHAERECADWRPATSNFVSRSTTHAARE